MKKEDKLLKAISYVLVAAVSVVLTLAAVQGRTSEVSPMSKLEEIETLIQERYIGETDHQALLDGAAAGMVEGAGDKWSYYIPADEYQDYMDRFANSYVGVGITVMQEEDQSGYRIQSVVPGGPAEEAGLLPGDLLFQVEGVPVGQMDVDEVHSRVVGEEGTQVELTVMRQGEHRTFQVERRRVETPVVEYEMLDGNIGLIRIDNFNSKASAESIQAIEALRSAGAEKLIFDVRYNPGGYAHELVALLDYLLPEGDLFRSQSYTGEESVDRSGPEYLDMPLAVLVNADTYSAAEFFAAAIQEYEAGVIVGQNTTGKGRYQVTYELDDGSAVNLSVGRYCTPNGVDLTDVGVTPDVRVTVDEETYWEIYAGLVDPADDIQIQAAIEALNKK